MLRCVQGYPGFGMQKWMHQIPEIRQIALNDRLASIRDLFESFQEESASDKSQSGWTPSAFSDLTTIRKVDVRRRVIIG
jgi:hypothetical protein